MANIPRNVLNSLWSMMSHALLRSARSGRIAVPTTSSTLTARPPTFWTKLNAWEEYQSARLLARLVFRRDQVNQLILTQLSQGQQPTYPELTNPIQADPLPTATLMNETEVSLHADDYLIKLVFTALRYLTSLHLRHRAEKSYDGHRVDIPWEFCIPGVDVTDPGNWVTFATLEYKRPNTISKEDFEHAEEGTPTNSRGKPLTLTQLKAILEKNCRPKTFIPEDINAFWLSKQAAKYANKFQCKYIALFDYGTMVTIDFRGASADSNGYYRSARICFFEEEKEAALTFQNPRTNRTLLLSFLHRALRTKIRDFQRENTGAEHLHKYVTCVRARFLMCL